MTLKAEKHSLTSDSSSLLSATTDENSDKKTESNILLYFKGLGTGLVWANADLRHHGKSELFCRPRDKSFTSEDWFRIYRQEYFRNKEMWDAAEFQPPGYILLRGLKTEYPCN